MKGKVRAVVRCGEIKVNIELSKCAPGSNVDKLRNTTVLTRQLDGQWCDAHRSGR